MAVASMSSTEFHAKVRSLFDGLNTVLLSPQDFQKVMQEIG